MQKSSEIKKLPQELVNQIAAGEVIERPSSVVKELVDNSIDAGATKIEIKIKNGGIDLIEISDNGIGIPKEMLISAFEAHSTSKISSVEELSELITMGFRGEALSTIVSIAKVSATSKHKDSDKAFQISFEGIEPKEIKPASGEPGTTIRIEDIFYNIPARKKFLKSAETEYRKILSILTPYFLIYPNIHFVLIKDSREVLNLPRESEEQGLSEKRFNKISKLEGGDLFSIKYDGGGTTLSGFISHPKNQSPKVTHLYIFVNNRPINDRAVIRSIIEGSRGFVPHGSKLPFAINIDVKPEWVDVNVHPRKEEVRFINPYRVYSAIEEAVRSALQSNLQQANQLGSYERGEDRSTGQSNGVLFDQSNISYKTTSSGSLKEISFKPRSDRLSIDQSLEFSKNVLDNEPYAETLPFSDSAQPLTNIENLRPNFISASQFFKKYLFLELEEELWVVDQHAAAERITFERLQNNYNTSAQNIQNLLVPHELELTLEESSFLSEHIDFFKKLGFGIEVADNKVGIMSLPAEFAGADIDKVFRSIFELEDNVETLKADFEKLKDAILATIACHNSIRTNQRLAPAECIGLTKQLLECNNPYSCPHGRPIIWKLRLTEIDSKFYRTY